MIKERSARLLVFVLLAAAVLVPLIAWQQESQGILIHAHMAETGGWTPENLTVQAGTPLKLRLTSDDVTHSFAVGQSNQPPVDVLPGEISEVTLVFDKPGKYTFYCTRWCSINHWRMRGTIEVTGPAGQESASQDVESPLYARLGMDIDAQHTADAVPMTMPSAQRGAQLSQMVPAAYLSREYYLSHAPVELWHALRAESGLKGLTDQEVWDLVAWVWQKNTTPQEVAEGQQLYVTNCAACHGERGGGDGVFADQLAPQEAENHDDMAFGAMTSRPVDFTNAEQMLSASPAHLQGKIIRGGMGTGMPSWGAIFTEEQRWALVAYLWKFQFDMEVP